MKTKQIHLFKGIRKHQNNVYQKRTKLLILIVDSCLSTLFAIYKKVLKIKCKISNITSDKDFHLANVKKNHKMTKILSNTRFLGKLFTGFILKDALPFA